MSVEDSRNTFPIRTITNIIGDPIYKEINQLRGTLYLIAAVIPTTPRGEGEGGGTMATLDLSQTYHYIQTCPQQLTQDKQSWAHMHNIGIAIQQRRDQTQTKYTRMRGGSTISMRMQTSSSSKRLSRRQSKPTYPRKNRCTWGSMASFPRALWITS